MDAAAPEATGLGTPGCCETPHGHVRVHIDWVIEPHHLFAFSVGTVPRDIAGSSTGRLALVGTFHGPTGQPRGWVASFAP